MKIQLLHTLDCHAWRDAFIVLEVALKDAHEAIRFEVILVENNDQAKRFKFLGSPTILVEGQDIDPMAKNATSFAASACRPYFYKGNSHDYPPKEMILEVLTKCKKNE